ncbi:hypothetical protein [Phyllobacterium sp. OV277]|uniref:hypothetical protein n=1 Tax=Phyllobacterium sp. OV277 TaxID=1882772 RepID=UPI001587AD64|nr:hypothetical protein [Phyllobacterium sp. OV277]
MRSYLARLAVVSGLIIAQEGRAASGSTAISASAAIWSPSGSQPVGHVIRALDT